MPTHPQDQRAIDARRSRDDATREPGFNQHPHIRGHLAHVPREKMYTVHDIAQVDQINPPWKPPHRLRLKSVQAVVEDLGEGTATLEIEVFVDETDESEIIASLEWDLRWSRESPPYHIPHGLGAVGPFDRVIARLNSDNENDTLSATINLRYTAHG